MDDPETFRTIPKRLETISDMTNNDLLESMVENNYLDTEIENNEDDIRNLVDKKYIDFTKAIKMLGGKLLYIKSGATGHTFKGIHIKSKSKLPYGVKVVAYPRKETYGDIYNSKRPENTEILMIKKLAYFVKKNHTPHIILPITTFNTSIKTFTSLPKDNIVNKKKYI